MRILLIMHLSILDIEFAFKILYILSLCLLQFNLQNGSVRLS